MEDGEWRMAGKFGRSAAIQAASMTTHLAPSIAQATREVTRTGNETAVVFNHGWNRMTRIKTEFAHEGTEASPQKLFTGANRENRERKSELGTLIPLLAHVKVRLYPQPRLPRSMFNFSIRASASSPLSLLPPVQSPCFFVFLRGQSFSP
jgi:hypothetical protein